jgi:hypothetical protein
LFSLNINTVHVFNSEEAPLLTQDKLHLFGNEFVHLFRNSADKELGINQQPVWSGSPPNFGFLAILSMGWFGLPSPLTTAPSIEENTDFLVELWRYAALTPVKCDETMQLERR